ncbi:ficolin-2-like [Saccostrea echinata]|uniref:ficolin-2-like n=1 Tax=Saccostrea echinata TaxID=191078 RepID=UPI002A823D35|nr:ficolin-2-like [Saccostrea echinata]
MAINYKLRPISIDCQDWYLTKGATLSGIYTIHPIGHTAVQVDCDMDTEDGGWTVIVKRSDGSVDFARNWEAYKNGFGNTPTEYWIGNQLIHILTNYNSALYIVITDTNDINFYEMYDHFSVSDEEDGFRIFFGNAVGNLGNSMMSTEEKFQLNGSRFTTVDMDQDNFPDNCAMTYGSGGGWWYNSCYKAQLTGPYGTAEWAWPWYPVFIDGTSIKAVKMMIKRKVQ